MRLDKPVVHTDKARQTEIKRQDSTRSAQTSPPKSRPLSTVFVFSSSSPVVHTDKARQTEIKRQDSTRSAQTSPPKSRLHTSLPVFSSRLSASRFACPTRYDDLASSSEDEDELSSPVCFQLSMPADPFSALCVPPPTVKSFFGTKIYNISYISVIT